MIKKVIFSCKAILYLLICLFWNFIKNVAILEFMLLNSLHQNFWIVRGKQTGKKYLKSTCKIVERKTLTPSDCASLPKFGLVCNRLLKNIEYFMLGQFLLNRIAIPKNFIFYYLLVQLLGQYISNYIQTLLLHFLF